MYGSRLIREFGESVPEVWRQAVGSLKRFEVDRGLRRLTTGGSASPPTLPQFMKACKQIGDDEGTLRPAVTYTPANALPPPSNRFVPTGSIALLRFILAENTPTDRIEDLRKIMLDAANDYLSISTVDQVTDDEFRAHCRKIWLKALQQRAA